MVDRAQVFQLNYLDPDYFHSDSGQQIDNHFVCSVCLGVVLEPQQCGKCERAYCKGCLVEGAQCPNRCGSSEYKTLGRFALNHLNSCQFKCQYASCKTITKYEQYQKHVQDCDEGKKMCNNKFCNQQKGEQAKELEQLKESIENYETTLQQKSNMVDSLRSQISEYKQMVKDLYNQKDKSTDSLKVQQQLQLKVVQLESEKKEYLSQIESISLKVKQLSENKLKDPTTIKCPNNHLLKMKDKHPNIHSTNIMCDICRKDHIDKQLIFFKCDMTCDFDMCSSCYILHLFNQTATIERVKEAVIRNQERARLSQAIEQIRVISLLSKLQQL
ncbi:UNKNOWN [Stylonychia lemnae]|uniref:Uncharacterized protein n=1 Tax=Stylonychia lemnae TaxID=5949 RepID=A0A078B0T0_STYLE|nr:UNKNOWN [Stylonychia lemnae]|eukprot:CDW87891.1 UNKNOWN [Stylonychia lemnae]